MSLKLTQIELFKFVRSVLRLQRHGGRCGRIDFVLLDLWGRGTTSRRPFDCRSSNSGTRGIDEEDSQENNDCDQATEEVELHQEFILTEVEIEIEAQQTSEGLSS